MVGLAVYNVEFCPVNKGFQHTVPSQGVIMSTSELSGKWYKQAMERLTNVKVATNTDAFMDF